jgi:glutathione S-transferase
LPFNPGQLDCRSPADPPAKSGSKARLLTLGHLDGRTMAAKRARELIEAIELDLGGADRLSEGSRQLVQRAAVLGAYIENCETRWLGGDAVDLSDYLAAINAQRRVLATLGLDRRARNVTPTVAEYVEHAAARDSA